MMLPDRAHLAALRNGKPERALEVGKAAEHLVCADLIMSGYRAFLSDQGTAYDVVMEDHGRLLRVQVKGTTKYRSVPNRPGSAPSYLFHVRRAGNGSKRLIRPDEFDILALVALDIRQVAYLSLSEKILQTIHLRAPGSPKNHANKSRLNVDEYPIRSALNDHFNR